MKYMVLAILLTGMGISSGCKSKKIITKPESERDTSPAKQGDTEIDYDEAVKKHFEMQSDRTKQMMINSDKKKKQRNYGLNRQWYDQLFNNSCFKNSAMVKTGHSYSTITSRKSCFIKD